MPSNKPHDGGSRLLWIDGPTRGLKPALYEGRLDAQPRTRSPA